MIGMPNPTFCILFFRMTEGNGTSVEICLCVLSITSLLFPYTPPLHPQIGIGHYLTVYYPRRTEVSLISSDRANLHPEPTLLQPRPEILSRRVYTECYPSSSPCPLRRPLWCKMMSSGPGVWAPFRGADLCGDLPAPPFLASLVRQPLLLLPQ